MKYVKNIKKATTKVFEEKRFDLHERKSNVEELEIKPRDIPLDITYASEELDTNLTDSIIFGVEWNKTEWYNKDTFEANLKTSVKENTKRGMLKLMVSIFDPLSIITTITLMFKEMYRQSCDLKLPSDGEIPTFLLKNRIKWSESLPQQTEIPRSILLFSNIVQSVELHLSGDADKTVVSAAVPVDTGRKLNIHKTFSLRPVSTGMYVILKQTEEKNQGLFFSIIRLSKKDLSVPRLELAAAHIAANSLGNTRYPIKICYRWSDSMVVPYWLHEK